MFMPTLPPHRRQRLGAAMGAMTVLLAMSLPATGAFIDERKPDPKPAVTPATAASSLGAPAVATATAIPSVAQPQPQSQPLPASSAPPTRTTAPAAGVPAAIPAVVAPAAPKPEAISASVVKLPEAGLPSGTVDGVFSDRGWATPAPRGTTAATFNSAFSRLLPPTHAPVTIEGRESVLDVEVAWPDTGLTREEALRYVAAAHGLNLVLGDGLLRVSRAQPARGLATYSVRVSDINFRRLLKRWSIQSGYAFSDEHWAAERDIPISGSADLGTDFKVAVRAALESTQFTAMPVRACFYSNNVLRVVPRNAQCNRDTSYSTQQ